MDRNARIFVAGHRGMAGSALVRRLAAGGYRNLLTVGRAQLDLLDRSAVESWLFAERPDYVVIAAARVGGIEANNRERADFLYQNLMIAANLIHGAHRAGVGGLMFLGSSCVYPRDCPQPIKEAYLLAGALEQTNEPYAIAKIAGVKLCESYNRQYGTRYVAVMPANLYGPNDNFDLHSGHVLAALLRKAHEARRDGAGRLLVWGSGTPMREFLHVDDMADACVHLIERDIGEGVYNIGTGTDVSIRELARIVRRVVGFEGDLAWDRSKPDGTPRKLLDVTRLAALGWRARIGLEQGIHATYRWYLESGRG